MSVQAIDNYMLLAEIMQATRNLARTMIFNAQSHIATANAQIALVATGKAVTVDEPTMASWVQAAAASYLGIINKAQAWAQNNTAQGNASMGIIGATLADLNNYAAPLKTAATTLAAADVSTYPNIIAAAQAVLAAVVSPPTMYS